METWTYFLKVSIFSAGISLITFGSSLRAQTPEVSEARQKAARCDLDYDILMDNIARHMPGRGPFVGEEKWKDYKFPLTIYKNNQECFTYRPGNPNYQNRSYAQDKVTPMWSATKSMAALATGMVMYRVDTYIDALIAQASSTDTYKIRAIDEHTYEIEAAGGKALIRRFTLNQNLFNWIEWSKSASNLFEDQPVHRGASVRQLLAMVARREEGVPEIQDARELTPKFEYDMLGDRGLNQVGFMAEAALKQFQNPLIPAPQNTTAIELSLDEFWNEQIKPSLGLATGAEWGIKPGLDGLDYFWETYVLGFSPLLSHGIVEERTEALPNGWKELSRKLSLEAMDKLITLLGGVPRFLPSIVKEDLASKFAGTKFYGFSWEASLEDMAKIGQVIMDQGVARKGLPHEKRMVSRSFIYEMTHASFPEANSAMGLSLWVNTPDKDNRIIVWNDDRKSQVKQAPFLDDHSLVSCAPVEGSQKDPTGTQYDSAVWTFLGAYGQIITGHPGLGLVLAYKDASQDDSRAIGLVWEKIVVQALVAKNPDFKSIEDFCAAYGSNQYAPYLKKAEPGLL
ncbi:MAG TPA: hypothetical protein VE954_31595 [Oligoflexus sp.]|uniref:hypothetical protein n=1 Tax=Oligoflexus sp. TaxID=1971216 RepID=UPI002D64DB73|nr:hypothetical protein [Oligoflexus sp.]HYX37669.1 hypothetical protein [Oligoflexus sp.]